MGAVDPVRGWSGDDDALCPGKQQGRGRNYFRVFVGYFRVSLTGPVDGSDKDLRQGIA